MGFLDSVKNAFRGAVTAPAPSVAAEPLRPPSAPADAAEPAGPEAPAPTSYTVRTGDTLGDIGARHGVSRDELARLNGIDEPDLIFPGQELRIPAS